MTASRENTVLSDPEENDFVRWIAWFQTTFLHMHAPSTLDFSSWCYPTINLEKNEAWDMRLFLRNKLSLILFVISVNSVTGGVGTHSYSSKCSPLIWCHLVSLTPILRFTSSLSPLQWSSPTYSVSEQALSSIWTMSRNSSWYFEAEQLEMNKQQRARSLLPHTGPNFCSWVHIYILHSLSSVGFSLWIQC